MAPNERAPAAVLVGGRVDRDEQPAARHDRVERRRVAILEREAQRDVVRRLVAAVAVDSRLSVPRRAIHRRCVGVAERQFDDRVERLRYRGRPDFRRARKREAGHPGVGQDADEGERGDRAAPGRDERGVAEAAGRRERDRRRHREARGHAHALSEERQAHQPAVRRLVQNRMAQERRPRAEREKEERRRRAEVEGERRAPAPRRAAGRRGGDGGGEEDERGRERLGDHVRGDRDRPGLNPPRPDELRDQTAEDLGAGRQGEEDRQRAHRPARFARSMPGPRDD